MYDDRFFHGNATQPEEIMAKEAGYPPLWFLCRVCRLNKTTLDVHFLSRPWIIPLKIICP
jgi:hypothetical protein